MHEVVEHLGDVRRWATEIVRTGQPPVVDNISAAGSDLVGWFEAGAADLVETLTASDPQATCWTFGFPPEQTWFWTRRQALEAAVHRFDVESAIRVPAPVPAELAQLGIEEVVGFLFGRQVTLGRTAALDGRVTLAATDADNTFAVGASGSRAAAITGTSEDLFLMLWGRPHGELHREGDAELLADFDAASLTPLMVLHRDLRADRGC